MTQTQFDTARDQGRWFDIFKECFQRDSGGNIFMRVALATIAATFGSAARGLNFDPSTAGKIKLLASGTDANIDIELAGKGSGGSILSLAKPIPGYGRTYAPLLMSQGWVSKIKDIAVGGKFLCIAPNGLIYTTDQSVAVRVINPIKGTQEASITVSLGSQGVAYCPSTNRIYVACRTAGEVKVINPDTNAVTNTIACTDAWFIVYCPSNDRIYVLNNTPGDIKVINPATEAVVATIGSIAGPITGAYCPTNDRLYVSSTGGLRVIDPSSNTVVATITVGTTPYGVCYSPANDRIYCANYTSGSVSVIDPSSNTVVATITVGANPSVITYSPIHGHIYIPQQGGSMAVIRAANNTVQQTVVMPTGCFAAAYSPHDGLIYTGTVAVTNMSATS